MKKTTVVTNSLRLWRYPFLVLFIFATLSCIQNWDVTGFGSFVLWFSFLGGVIAFATKRVEFDDGYLYLKRFNSQRKIALKNITAIKRSSMKVNGTRLWKIVYNEAGFEKKILYKEGSFRSGSTREMISATRKQNSNVVVWEHPHFNH